jgi:hypothetical protein
VAVVNAIDVGTWREPIMPDYPTTAEQVAWARNRPAHARTPLPAVGDVVGWRTANYGPVTRAKVLSVGMDRPGDTRPGAEIDWNVWRYMVVLGPNGSRRPYEISARGDRGIELIDDPWPDVLLETLDGPKLRIVTREARLPGSAGWLRGKE